MMTAWIDRLLPAPASAHAAAFDGVLKAVHLHALLVLAAWLALFLVILVRFRAGARRPAAAPLRGWWPYAAVAARCWSATWCCSPVRPCPYGARERRRCRPAPSRSGSPPSSSPGTSTTPAWTARFGPTSPALISAADPLGVDRTHPDGKDDIVLINVLRCRAGARSSSTSRARDVIHGFTLPQMRVKQDVVPGLPVTTWFSRCANGEWEIVCSQLCGLGHYRMRGEFAVLAPERVGGLGARGIGAGGHSLRIL